ncbi:MAG TPA: amidohydrolase, partial [Brevundimonas diminuta]|nr:amidohydrolase [Brevundimonas diminuta]
MKPVSLRALALAAALAAPLSALPAHAAELSAQDKQSLLATVDRNQAALDHAALEIWKFAELGYQETQSSALLQGQLRDA